MDNYKNENIDYLKVLHLIIIMILLFSVIIVIVLNFILIDILFVFGVFMVFLFSYYFLHLKWDGLFLSLTSIPKNNTKNTTNKIIIIMDIGSDTKASIKPLTTLYSW